MNEQRLHLDVRIGHVHLRVADLERATAFYRDYIGLDVVAYGPDFGLPGAAFLSAGGYHHHVGLNTWSSEGGGPPPEGHTGLHHVAFLYLDRRELARRGAPDRPRLPHRGGRGPRRHRLGLPQRPGRERHRALLRQAAGGLVRLAGHPDPQGRTVRPAGSAGGTEPALVSQGGAMTFVLVHGGWPGFCSR